LGFDAQMPPGLLERHLDIPALDKQGNNGGDRLIHVGAKDGHRFGFASGINQEDPANRDGSLARCVP
jgi:hypothetical protein